MTLSELQPRIGLVSMAMKLTLGIHFVLLLTMIYSIDLFGEINDGEYVSSSSLDTYATVTMAFTSAAFMIFIFTAVAFVRWMLGVFDFNEFHGAHHPFERNYVAWAFFIPIVNIVRPYQAVSGLMETTLQLSAREEHPIMNSLLPWWLAYLFGNLVNQLADRLVRSTENIDAYITAFWMQAGAAVLTLASGYLILRVIEQHQELISEATLKDQIDLIGGEEEEDRW